MNTKIDEWAFAVMMFCMGVAFLAIAICAVIKTAQGQPFLIQQ